MAVDTRCCTDNDELEEDRMTRELDDDFENDDEHEYDLYVLDAFRWMWQRANGETIDEYEDPYSDAFERWHMAMDENCRVFESEVNKRSELVLAELEKIKALSYEDLLKGYMYAIDDYFGGSAKFAAYDRKVTSTLHCVLEKII